MSKYNVRLFDIPCSSVRYSLLLIASLLLAGCGGDGPAMGPVEGTVTHNGRPLERGTIVFHPAKGRPAHGKIEDGRISRVTTLRAGDGATVGPNKVAIQSLQRSADMNVPSKSLIPQRYANAGQSGLSAEIKPGESNELTFELTD